MVLRGDGHHLLKVFVETEGSRKLCQIHVVDVKNEAELVRVPCVRTGRRILCYLRHVDKVERHSGRHGVPHYLAKPVNRLLRLIWVLDILKLLESKFAGLLFED